MRALGPIGWDEGELLPDSRRRSAIPPTKIHGQNNISNVHSTAEKFRRSWGTHSARAVLECPRVSFAADEIRLIRPINVLNIVATVATDDHLARLHGGFVLPPSSTSSHLTSPCISFSFIRYLLCLSCLVPRSRLDESVDRIRIRGYNHFLFFCESTYRKMDTKSPRRELVTSLDTRKGRKKLA